MSQQSCSACNDLREYAPNFVVNGVNDEVCENLSLNKGLSDADGHIDCDDLHDVNDCLIANMDDEVESFEVCDWKEFMHQYIPNNYETLKAMICSMCGQWDKLESVCALITSVVAPPVVKYGSLPQASSSANRCGTIPKKNGTPVMIEQDVSSHPLAYLQNVGIYYASTRIRSCESDKCELHEWIYPSTYLYYISEDVEKGDVLWYVDKATLQAKTGFSEHLWEVYTISSFTWRNTPIDNGAASGKFAWLTLTTNPGNMGANYFGIVFSGTSYPNEAPGYNAHVSEMGDFTRHTVSSC